jgi:hypothetical protein
MNPLTAKQHASAHAQYCVPNDAAPVHGIVANPGEIVGTFTVLALLSCCRAEDQGRPYKTRSYQIPLNGQFRGSQFLVNHLPPELDVMANNMIRTVQRWEWRAVKDAERQSQIIRPPGFQA